MFFKRINVYTYHELPNIWLWPILKVTATSCFLTNLKSTSYTLPFATAFGIPILLSYLELSTLLSLCQPFLSGVCLLVHPFMRSILYINYSWHGLQNLSLLLPPYVSYHKGHMFTFSMYFNGNVTTWVIKLWPYMDSPSLVNPDKSFIAPEPLVKRCYINW